MKKIFYIILVVLFHSILMAADHYVLDGGSGDCSTENNWATACDDLPAALTRGDTYYIGDGTYSSYIFDDNVDGATYITIKKCNTGDGTCENATGYSSGDHDGQATFGYFEFDTSYYYIDGNDTSGYGFALTSAQSNRMLDTEDSNYITVKSLTANAGGVGLRRPFFTYHSSYLTFENLEGWNSDNDPLFLEDVDNSSFNKIYIHTRNGAGIDTHGDAIEIHSCSNITISNSRFDWDGQHIFWGGDTAGANGRFDIYGNRHWGGETSGQALCRNSSGTGGPIYVYNNSICCMNTAIIEGGMTFGAVENNVFIAEDAKTVNVPNMGYNYYSTDITGYTDANAQTGANPFTDSSNGDFTLTGATEAGNDLSGWNELYGSINTDPDGTTRGGDGVWDRGAYEYGAGTNSPSMSGTALSMKE